MWQWWLLCLLQWIAFSLAWAPRHAATRQSDGSFHHHSITVAAQDRDFSLENGDTNNNETTINSKAQNRRSLLEKAGGVIYRKSVFPRDEFSTLGKEIQAHMNELQAEIGGIAEKRVGATLDSSSSVLKLLKQGNLHTLVEKAVGAPCELSTDIPVEIRVYAQKGAGMAWHVDDVLYDPPQIEVVWTLENDSDCVTMWKEGSGSVSDNQLHSVETEPNSAILLLAGMAPHCVSHLKYGKRTILKFAYIQKGAQFREGKHKNQFQKQNSKKNGKRKAKRR